MIFLILSTSLITSPGTLGPHDCAEVTSAAVGYRFSGRVVHVVDADTIDLGRGPTCVRVRLTDFNAVECAQPCRDRGSTILRQVTTDKVVSCVVERGRNGRRTVSHDRVLARCSVDGVALGKRLKKARVPQGGR